jgi:CubicO group peptidase (beta-lactamase class C family)
MSFDQFLKRRLFDPFGMKNTTFYPTVEQLRHRVTVYARNKELGDLEPVAPRATFGPKSASDNSE